MPQTGSAEEERLDLLLGKVALERGLISEAQLREALSEQALGVTRGRRLPRPIGSILASGKLLRDEQVLALEKELGERLRGEAADRQKDVFFGQILVDGDFAASVHVDEAVRAQAEMFRQGHSPLPKLGEILVERGFATSSDIEQALALQKAMVRVCSKCKRECSLSEASDTPQCPLCRGDFEASVASLSFTGAAPPPPADLPQEAVAEILPRPFGKYSLKRVLGRGGMGLVYEAADGTLGRTVAIKFMLRGSGSDPKDGSHEVDRFIREAQVAAKLRHPNIVSIHEAGIIDDQRYIAMEYVDGLSMDRWRKSGSITIRQQIRILRDVAQGVHYAHQQGVTHRDLKPQNIIVDPRGKPYVTDFGLAKEAGKEVSVSLTVEGAILGTPGYMSPEQAKGAKSVGKQTDVWALGILLYETLAGRRPFRGESPMAIIIKVIKDPVQPPSEAAPSVFAGPMYRPLEKICMRALQKEPGSRYGSAADLATDLSKWLKGDEVHVPTRRFAARPRKIVWIAGAAAALVLALLLALATGGGQSSRWRIPLKQGNDFLAEGRGFEARQVFDHILKAEPEEPEALRGLKAALDLLGTAPLPPEDRRGATFPVRWLLSKPYPSSTPRDLDAALAPEGPFDPAAWRTADAGSAFAGGAEFDFVKMLPPFLNVIIYAAIHVRAPSEMPVRLYIGSDDGVKVWLNGAQIHRNAVQRALKRDDDVVTDRLKAGWNRIIMKIQQGTGGAGLALRLTDTSGRPIPGLEFDPYGDTPGAPPAGR